MDQQRQSNLFSNNNEGYLHSLRSSRPVPKGFNPFNSSSNSLHSTVKAKGHITKTSNDGQDHMETLQTQKKLLYTPHKVEKDSGNESKVTLNNFQVNFNQFPQQQVNKSLFLGVKPFIEHSEENKENSNLNSNQSRPNNQFSSSSNSFRHFSDSSKNNSEGVGGFKVPKKTNFISNLNGDNSFVVNLQPKFGSGDSNQNNTIFSKNRESLNNPIISTLISNSSSASQSQGEENSSLNISKEEREEINVESNFNNGNDYNSNNSNNISLSPRLNSGYNNSNSLSNGLRNGLQTLNNQNNNFNNGCNQIILNNPFNNNPFSTMNNNQIGYQSISNNNGFNNIHNTNQNSNGLSQGMNNFQNVEEYSQQSLTESFMAKTSFYIPPERSNDEKFKLLALKNIRKPQFKDNRSISNADMTGVPKTNPKPTLNSNPFLQGTGELTLPSNIVFNSNQYYKDCFNSDDEPETMQQNPLYNQKKKKVAHSVKRHYMSTINFTESETGDRKSFYIYKDGERGFTEKWQQMIRPVTMDEDVPSDEDVIRNGTRRNLDELMDACQLVMVEKRLDLVRNRDMITYK